MWKFVFYISGHRRNIYISLIKGVNHILHTVNKHNSMNSNEDLQRGKLLRRKMHAYQRDKNEEFSTNERGMRNCCMSKKNTLLEELHNYQAECHESKKAGSTTAKMFTKKDNNVL